MLESLLLPHFTLAVGKIVGVGRVDVQLWSSATRVVVRQSRRLSRRRARLSRRLDLAAIHQRLARTSSHRPNMLALIGPKRPPKSPNTMGLLHGILLCPCCVCWQG